MKYFAVHYVEPFESVISIQYHFITRFHPYKDINVFILIRRKEYNAEKDTHSRTKTTQHYVTTREDN